MKNGSSVFSVQFSVVTRFLPELRKLKTEHLKPAQALGFQSPVGCDTLRFWNSKDGFFTPAMDCADMPPLKNS